MVQTHVAAHILHHVLDEIEECTKIADPTSRDAALEALFGLTVRLGIDTVVRDALVGVEWRLPKKPTLFDRFRASIGKPKDYTYLTTDVLEALANAAENGYPVDPDMTAENVVREIHDLSGLANFRPEDDEQMEHAIAGVTIWRKLESSK